MNYPKQFNTKSICSNWAKSKSKYLAEQQIIKRIKFSPIKKGFHSIF